MERERERERERGKWEEGEITRVFEKLVREGGGTNCFAFGIIPTPKHRIGSCQHRAP